jgi:hypothetical protein
MPISRSLLAAAAALLLAYGAPAAAQKNPPPGADPPALVPPEEPPPPYPPLAGAEAEAVRDVVRQYQDAVRRRDGAAAARLVTADTRAFYGRMRDMAVSAPEAQVRAAPLIERISILMYRHRVPAEELRALPADSAFAYTIRSGWVTAMDGDEFAAQAAVYGEGDRAALRNMGDTFFVREDGAWRWDMLPLILGASEEFGEGLETPEEQDEFTMLVLRMSNGREPSPEIWKPIGPR